MLSPVTATYLLIAPVGSRLMLATACHRQDNCLDRDLYARQSDTIGVREIGQDLIWSLFVRRYIGPPLMAEIPFTFADVRVRSHKISMGARPAAAACTRR